MDYFDWLQWPAMIMTIVAAWLIGSLKPKRRLIGFYCFMISNLLWGVWGWHTNAWALIILQISLCLMNVRGCRKNLAEARQA